MTEALGQRVERPCLAGWNADSVVDVMADGTSRARDDVSSSPRIALLSGTINRLEAMRAAIAYEAEPLVTLTHLLHLCRDDHRTLWEGADDPHIIQRAASLRHKLADLLPPSSSAEALEPRVRRALVNAFDEPGIAPVAVARMLAELIDERYCHTFSDSFRRRSPYQPGVGDPVPLDSPDLRHVLAMRSTSPPWRLANRLDETRHVRLAGEWAVRFRTVFDYDTFDALAGAISPDTILATCHPNRSLGELDLTSGANNRIFPIGPADPERQRTEIHRLISRATAAGASIVVLPELCVTEQLAWELEKWVRLPDGPRLLVAGSYHQVSDTGNLLPARRRNTAVAWVRGIDQPLTHDKFSPADRPVVEDIQPDGWPELRVYVTADGWHMAIAVCRDFLNPQAVNAISEAGVNVLFVPAMSETLMPFGGPVAHLVGACQAIVAVANNPGDWSRESDPVAQQPARALFGHPGLGQQIRLVGTPDPGPGVALLTVRSAAITWLPDTFRTRAVPETSPSKDLTRSPRRPAWLTPLFARAKHPAPPSRQPMKAISLRPAAVLVLVSNGPSGPCVLLTERAADLTDYPGQLVFPGGAVDPRETSPVDTALREAREEIGLDVDSIEVIGLLAPLALPDSGFYVDVVLAWSANPIVRRSLNYAEVAALHEVPLSELATRSTDPTARTHIAAAESGGPDLQTLGRMTEAVIDQLLGIVLPRDQPSAVVAQQAAAQRGRRHL